MSIHELGCKATRLGTDCECNCAYGRVRQEPELSPAHARIIKAAEDAARIYGQGGCDGAAFAQAMSDLCGAVRALHPAPRPLRPSDLKPGQRFRFGNPHNGEVHADASAYILVRDEENYCWAVDERDWRSFKPDSDSACFPID